MSRITLHTKCRLCRAAGTKLYLKGARCFSAKCPIEKKGAVPPGMHGTKRSRKPTDYGIQLKAKQQAKRIYGVQETQFKNLYLKAKKIKGPIGDNLMSLLEKRLDNVVYQSGLSSSRSHAKQLVSHGHILVNDKVLTIGSHGLKIGDRITLAAGVKPDLSDTFRFADKDFKAPQWLDLNKTKRIVSVVSEPTGEDFNQGIDVNLIIEYYSR